MMIHPSYKEMIDAVNQDVRDRSSTATSRSQRSITKARNRSQSRWMKYLKGPSKSCLRKQTESISLGGARVTGPFLL